MATLSEDTELNLKGDELFKLIERLYPICRSITGEGVRKTLKILQELIPLEIKEVPSGTKVFDWVVPKEWNINDAYIKNSKGEKLIDFKKSNLHVVNYSIPINKKITLKELNENLHSLLNFPDWIPYLTSYYKESWGFCLTQKQRDALPDDIYEVVIDSTLKDGSLTYGELFLPGESAEEILFTCYVCHPSLCNDNLSGTAVLAFLAQELQKKKRNKSYRFLFLVETIGAITWLAINQEKLPNIKGGLVAVDLGDAGGMTYKKTRDGNSIIDQIVLAVLAESGKPHTILNFSPLGSDERQFSSPGINLNVGSLMRTHYEAYPEYHTSADNLQFMNKKSLAESLKIYEEIAYLLDKNQIFISTNQYCEPQLGRRGLYSFLGGQKERKIDTKAIFWVLNFSDGYHSLLDISLKSGMSFREIRKAAEILMKMGL